MKEYKEDNLWVEATVLKAATLPRKLSEVVQELAEKR